MIEVVRYEAWHMNRLAVQDAQAPLFGMVRPEHALAVEGPMAFTALAGGEPLCCAGVIEYWPGRGETWAVLAKGCRREFMAITNAVRRFLDICPVRRVEASVPVEFEAGHRWVRSLGFALEAPRLRAYLPDGSDCALYARVN